MALFQKNKRTENDSEHNFSDYVDSLLQADDAAPGTREPALRPNYGIDQAIALMRKMPHDNQTLVISVVRDTLQSANIDVDAIIVDAENRSDSLKHEVSDLKQKIDALRGEISDMEEQIKSSEKELAETAKVRELLQASIGTKKPATIPAAMAPAAPVATDQEPPSAAKQTSIELDRNEKLAS